jgi:hypothetical protein
MLENAGTLVAAIAFLVALLGSGVGVAFLVGRRGSRTAIGEQAEKAQHLSEPFVKELQRCLELSDYVTRDADTLSAIVAAQSPPVARQVTSAVNQLIKTTKSLAGRLNRVGAEARIASPPRDVRPITLSVNRSDSELPTTWPQPTALAQDDVEAAPQKVERVLATPFQDARRFPRSSFRGTAKATIYPRHPGPGREPVQCTLLTRDLSCGGIGVAHSEQLFPKQIVVLEAVGRLLVGEVRWCRRVDEHFYVAGCRLVKMNS